MSEEKECCCCCKEKGKKSKKGLGIKVVLGIIVLLVVLLVAVALFLGSIVKTGIQTVGSKITKSQITVENVKFSLLKGQLEVNSLVVGNPEGFHTESAFKLGKVYVSLQPMSLFTGERTIVNEVLIENPEITYELDPASFSSNIGRIQENVQSFLPAKDENEKKEEPKEEKPGRPVEIDHVLVSGGKINFSATFAGGSALPIPLPTVEMNDIGKEDKVSMAEAMATMLNKICGSIVDAAKGSAKAIGDAVSKGADAATETLKKGGAALNDAAKSIGNVFGFGKKNEQATEQK